MPRISVIEPVSRAMDTVKQTLFAPFDIIRWFGMGFTAWLALLSGGGFPGLNFCNTWNKESGTQPFQAAWQWVLAHLVLVISLAVCIGFFILVILLAISWISSRGKFMFLDNVVHNRAEIIEPWQRYPTQGNSFFLFSICLGLASLALLLAISVISFLIAMPDITRHHFSVNAISGVVVGGLLLLVYGVSLTCVTVFLGDFIVPIMVLRSCRVMAAWGFFFDLFKAHTGMFILYFLFKIVLGWAIGAIMMLACCILCCIMWIPYINTVVLLPLFVFLRSYSIHFLEQFGESYRLFHREPPNYLTVAHESSPSPG